MCVLFAALSVLILFKFFSSRSQSDDPFANVKDETDPTACVEIITEIKIEDEMQINDAETAAAAAAVTKEPVASTSKAASAVKETPTKVCTIRFCCKVVLDCFNSKVV